MFLIEIFLKSNHRIKNNKHNKDGDHMENFIYRSDLAVDLREEDGFTSNHTYDKKMINGILVEKMILNEDDPKFQKQQGCYISLSFEELELEDVREVLIDVLKEQISEIINYMKIPCLKKVLVCGLGNALLSCDSLGPLLQDQLIVSAHLKELDELEDKIKVALLIPRVKAQTGMETFDIIYGTIGQFQPDLVIVVDALATKNIGKVNHVIQLSSAGIQPGSGVGNQTKALSAKALGVPLVSLGVPTVVDCASITYDVLRLMEDYFASQMIRPYEKLKVSKRGIDHLRLKRTQREMLFGEIGKLSDDEKRYLLEEIIRPTGLNMIVMDKNTDLAIKELSKVIAHALNDFFLEGA